MILLCSKFISKTSSIKFSKLIVQRVLGSSQVGSMILLCSKFISKTSSINHCLLCFFLCILCSYKHTINLCLHGMDGRFQLALCSHITSVDGLHIVDSTTSISDVSLQLTLSTARSVQKSFAFLNFSRESSCLALRDANLLSDLCFCTSFIFKELNGFTKLCLISLDALQTFSISFVCMVKTNFKLIDFSL